MFFRLIIALSGIKILLISSFVWGAEVRKLGVNDLQYGADVTSPAGEFVTGIQPVDARAYSTLSDAVASASGNTLLIANAQKVSVDTTIDSTVHIVVVRGGSFVVAAGKTLTINGPFSAGLYPAFSGRGSVVFGAGSIPEAYPEWWGARGDLSADTTAAIQSAIDSRVPDGNNNSGSIVKLSGKYLVNGTIYIKYNGVKIYGTNIHTSQLKFNPSFGTPGNRAKLISIQAAKPANLIQQIVLKDFGIMATYPSTYSKQAISISDGSYITIENVSTPDWSWTTASGTPVKNVFFVFAGRDQHTISRCNVTADMPVYITKNRNTSLYQFDVMHFHDLSLHTWDPNEYAITFDSGVNITQWIMDGRSIALGGKGGIYFNDTKSGTATSGQITIDNYRIESGNLSSQSYCKAKGVPFACCTGVGVGATCGRGGYGIYMDFGVRNPLASNIRISNSSVNDGTANGYRFNRVSTLELNHINAGFSATNKALILDNVMRATVTSLGIGNDNATVQFNNMNARFVSKFYSNYAYPTNPSVSFGIFEYHDVDTPSRNLVYNNGVKKWDRAQATDSGTNISLPALTSGQSMIVTVSCNLGYAQYHVNYAGVMKIAGSDPFGVNGSGSITLLADGAGNSKVSNVSAGHQTIVISTSGS